MIKLFSSALKTIFRLFRDFFRVILLQASVPGSYVDYRVKISTCLGGRLSIGAGFVLGAYSVIILENFDGPDGVVHPSLMVGDNVYIGELNNIRVNGVVKIGGGTLISQGVSIISTNHATSSGELVASKRWRTDRVGVSIGDNVWIGANSTILPGVSIGDGAIIAAGSVVLSDVGSNSVYGGVPARFIKHR